jgi:hypothetical protein
VRFHLNCFFLAKWSLYCFDETYSLFLFYFQALPLLPMASEDEDTLRIKFLIEAGSLYHIVNPSVGRFLLYVNYLTSV